MAQYKKAMRCPAGIVSVGGRWKLEIWYHLLDGTRRFGELQRLIPEASRQMLTLQLRDLEQMGIVHREAYAQVPPKVEYSLTELGRSFEPMLRQMWTLWEQYNVQTSLEGLRLVAGAEARKEKQNGRHMLTTQAE